jgi:hypothetical protein
MVDPCKGKKRNDADICKRQKLTREDMVEKLIGMDIEDIRQALCREDDLEFLYAVLSGQGWKPYIQLTDKQIKAEYEDRVEE